MVEGAGRSSGGSGLGQGWWLRNVRGKEGRGGGWG